MKKPKFKTRPRAPMGKAIKAYCLDCAGGTQKERLLCHLFDCPLWEWRLGGHYSSAGPARSMRAAFDHHKEEWLELTRMGITKDMFLPPNFVVGGSPRSPRRKTRAKAAHDMGQEEDS